MFPELASGHFLPALTTTPPHFAAPRRLMSPTRPVKIFLFVEFLAAFTACFRLVVNSAASLSDLRDSLLQQLLILM